MLLFWISIGLFVFALAGFMILLGLWTYADAKVRTDNPAIWTLIVLLAPNLLGLIIYLLVGRSKEQKSTGRFKKPLITFAVCFILATGLMAGNFVHLAVSDRVELPWGVSSGIFMAKIENYWNREWTVSVKSAKGELSKVVNLGDDDLAAFHVAGDCGGGNVYLKISQGETIKTIDISASFNETIDMSEFYPGKVKLVLEFDSTKSADVSVSWRR